MKVSRLALALLFTTMTDASAQKGSIKVGASAEVAFPFHDTFGYIEEVGYGGSIKGFYGVRETGDLTLTAGYLFFPIEQPLRSIDGALVPVLVGYRQSFNRIFIEPQIGVSSYRINLEHGTERYMQLAIGIGAGWQLKDFEIGARYQRGNTQQKTTSFVAFRVGYNLKLHS